MRHIKKEKHFSLKGFLLKGLGYSILTFFSVFVLLPLIWMIITAFKQEGQAFRLQLLPDRQQGVENFTAEKIQIGSKGAVFQYENPQAETAAVAGSFNNWDSGTHPMYQAGDLWHLYIEDIPAGTHEYKLVINHDQWILDPGNPDRIDDNSIIIIEEDQPVFNTRPLLYSTKENDMFQLHFYAPDARNMRMEKNGDTLRTSLKNEYWQAAVSGEKMISISYNLPFMRALNELYTLENFRYILFNEEFPFYRFFINSVVIATLAGFLTVFICTFAGYAFACRKIPHADLFFNLLMLSMMIPGMIYMVPQFALVVRFGWINSYQGLIIPHLANIFGLLLLRQYMRTIPDSLFQSAKIDGASELQIVSNIVVPLCLPIMVTLFLLVFVTQWSNFLWQLIVNTPDSRLLTLPVGLNYFRGQYGASWEAIMAGACFSIIPIALLFLFAQRYFIQGLTQGAVKE